MTSSSDLSDDLQVKYLGPAAVAAVLLGAAVVRWRFGWPSVALWLAFCALSGAALLFWEALRSALDPLAPGDGEDDPVVRLLAQSELEERKKAALRAIKDLQFEFSIGRLSEQDFNELSERYRNEARQVMVELDAALGTHLQEAEAEFDRIAAEAQTQPDAKAAETDSVSKKAEKSSQVPKVKSGERAAEQAGQEGLSTSNATDKTCAKCATRNDVDAKFCKNCAEPLGDTKPPVATDPLEKSQ